VTLDYQHSRCFKYYFRYLRNMSLGYAEALSSLFGAEPFTATEFARRANVPRAAKILSELKSRGIVERTGRGVYRNLAPRERPDLRTSEWSRVRDVVLAGPDPKAWTGKTAVEIWTAGRYRLAPSAFFRVFEVSIPRDRVAAWERYLAERKVRTHPDKRVGACVTLVPSGRFRREMVSGEPVIPRSAVERLIDGHPALFANARELLVS
jgi:hypothetical protein